MDFDEEENEVSDLEELEFALYSQIHYDSKNCDIVNEAPNYHYENVPNTPSVNVDYDISVKCINNDSKCSTSKGCSMGSMQNFDKVKKRKKSNSVITSQEDSAIGLESFLSLDTTGKSVPPGSDLVECIQEENSKATEVLSKKRQSKLPGTYACTNKSVIEIETDSEDSVILLSDNDNFDIDVENISVNSDDMVLDEELSDLEGLHVNVDEEHQAKLSTEYDFAHHQKTWHIIDADRFGTVPHHAKGRYYGSEFDRCHNCKENGHMAKSCPKPRKVEICILCGFIGHFHRTCQNRACYKCECPGHTSKDCPERAVSKWNPCFRCGMQGHNKKTCPDQWRQYHLTTDGKSFRRGRNQKNPRKYCYNCAEEGHYGYECEDERMDNYSFPSYPFIQSYDFPDAKKPNKRGLNQDSSEGFSKKAKKAKTVAPVERNTGFIREQKKKKSKKLKRIYERLETEKKQSKRKKKKGQQSESFCKQVGDSEQCGVRTVTRDAKGFHGNNQSLTITVTQEKGKKNGKLKRIYNRIQTEKQQMNGSIQNNKGKQVWLKFNPNWQRMKNNNQGPPGPNGKPVKNGHVAPSGRGRARFNANPINAFKGFKTNINH